MVAGNPALSDLENFYYLSGNLDGEAKGVIEEIEFCDDGFKLAWDALISRYDDKKSIIDKHVRSFFNLKPVQRESKYELQQLLDDSLRNLRALENLGEKLSDVVIVYTIKERLDKETRKLWENEFKLNISPTWKEMVDFLQGRCRILAVLGDNSKQEIGVSSNHKRKESHSKTFVTSEISQTSKSYVCGICRQNHFITECRKFLNLTAEQRYEKARQIGLCLNCLKGRHRAFECRGPRCVYCNKKHNKFLHMESADKSASESNKLQNKTPCRGMGSSQSENMSKEPNRNTGNINNGITLYCHKDNKKIQILLSTAMIGILDSQGQSHLCRALLDSASQSNFISAELADKLAISKSFVAHSIAGLNNTKTDIKNKIITKINSRINGFDCQVDFLVVPEIANNLPSEYISIDNWQIPKGIVLADPNFNIPGSIDVLLGAEVFYKVLVDGSLKLAQNLPMLHDTMFGWVIGGKYENSFNFLLSSNDAQVDMERKLAQQVQRFWEAESCELKPVLTLEEKQCEQLYADTYSRDENGRFRVNLPLKENFVCLGDSRKMAVTRFEYLEK